MAMTIPPVSVARSSDVRRAGLARVPERVREDEPPLGVGVGDLDRLPAERRDDVAGAEGMAARQVLAGRHDREDPHGQPELGDRAHRGEDGAAAAHVRLHLVHAVGGLQREAAGVERDRLADEADAEVGLAAAPAARRRA